jgi:hypothetical protein
LVSSVSQSEELSLALNPSFFCAIMIECGFVKKSSYQKYSICSLRHLPPS